MKRIAVINDISSFGRCSLTAALPIVSALGVQCCPLPTGVFSAQTGFPGFYCRDLTEDMPRIVEKWVGDHGRFDAALTGFITNAGQGREILRIIRRFKKDGALIIVDPVLGDNGEAYPGCGEAHVEMMKSLADEADIITPNFTELCILAGAETGSVKKGSEIIETVRKLCEKICGCGQTILTTGIGTDMGKIGVGVFSGGRIEIVEGEKIGGSFSGTGDVFASFVAAEIVSGVEVTEAVRKAVSFISTCIRKTLSDNPGHDPREGIEFEKMIGVREK